MPQLLVSNGKFIKKTNPALTKLVSNRFEHQFQVPKIIHPLSACDDKKHRSRYTQNMFLDEGQQSAYGPFHFV